MTRSIILLILLLGFYPFPVLSTGLEVTPAQLTLASGGKSEIKVKNPTAETLEFDVYADDYPEEVKVSPAKFALSPGQNRTVKVASTTRREFNTKLSVVASPTDSRAFPAAAGTKIPLTVESGQRTDWIVWAIYAVMFFGSLFLITLWPKKRFHE